MIKQILFFIKTWPCNKVPIPLFGFLTKWLFGHWWMKFTSEDENICYKKCQWCGETQTKDTWLWKESTKEEKKFMLDVQKQVDIFKQEMKQHFTRSKNAKT